MRVLQRGKDPEERRALEEENGHVARIADERADGAGVASHHPGGRGSSERLEDHPRTLRADAPSRPQIWHLKRVGAA